MIVLSEVRTSLQTNPTGSISHIGLAFETPSATLTLVGDELVSVGLKPIAAQTSFAIGSKKYDLSTETIAAINAIALNGPTWAQQAGGAPEWYKLVNGGVSTRDGFKTLAESFLSPYPVDPVLVTTVDVLVN